MVPAVNTVYSDSRIVSRWPMRWARRAGAESPRKSLDSGLAPQLLTSCGMISGAGYSAPANAGSAVGVSPAPVSRYGRDLDEVLIAVSGSTGGSETLRN